MSPFPRPIRSPDRAGIYVHYPFCIQKCSYCDFYSIPLDRSSGMESAYIRAIKAEWEQRLPLFHACHTVDSVFFGGGTPSLLPPDTIRNLIDLFRSEFSFAKDCEITIEANPENVTLDLLQGLADAGVNRLSVGIQTFSEAGLRAMNRYYDADRYAHILEILAESPIRNRSVDLIYGLPGQTEADFFKDIRHVLNTKIEHLSLYSLTAEPGTPYARSVREGSMRAPDEDMQSAIFQDLPSLLQEEGFEHYEISNYARDGFPCRHNLRYWMYEPYLGLGPSAHGFNGLLRYGNPRNIERWMQHPGSGNTETHHPWIDAPLNLFRLAVPFPHAWLTEILGQEAEPLLLDFFSEQTEKGRCKTLPGGLVQWTENGLLFLDSILEEWVARIPETQKAK